MLTDFTSYSEYINNECYCLIVRISSLLAYYDFKHLEVTIQKFKNYKHLYSIGNQCDLATIFLALTEIFNYLSNIILLSLV